VSKHFLSTDNITSAIWDDARDRFVAGTTDGKIILVNSVSWNKVYEVSAHVGPVNALTFSSDGERLISVGRDGKTIVSNAADGSQKWTVQGIGGSANCVSMHPQDHRIVVGYDYGNVREFAFPVQSQPKLFRSQDARTRALIWARDESKLTQVGDKGCTAWDAASGTPADATSFEPGTFELASPLGDMAASFQTPVQSSVLIRELSTARPVCELRLGGPSTELQVAWAPDGRHIAAFRHNVVNVWTVPAGDRVLQFEGIRVSSVAFSSDGLHIAIAGGGDKIDDGYLAHAAHVHIFNVKSTLRVHKLGIPTDSAGRNSMACVAWSRSGDRIAGGNHSGHILIWSAADGALLHTIKHHEGKVQSLDWSPDGLRLSSTVEDIVSVCDTATGDELWHTDLGDLKPEAVQWSPRGRRLAAADAAGHIWVWGADNGYEAVNRPQNQALFAFQRYLKSGMSAKDELQKAMTLDPECRIYHQALVARHLGAGQIREAIDSIGSAISVNPSDPFWLYLRSTLNIERQDYDAAVEDLRLYRALHDDPRSAYLLCLAHLLRGDIDEYRAVSNQLFEGDYFELSTDLATRIWTHALLATSADDAEAKLNILEQARSSPYNRDSLDLLECKGFLLFRAGRFEEAISELHNLNAVAGQLWTTAQPPDEYSRLPAYTWYLLAMASHCVGRQDETQAWYEKAEKYSNTMINSPSNGSNPLLLRALSWHQRLYLTTLRSEAQAVLGK
jgi:WD40 repeat protein